jgi:adenylosuccinate lyase
MILLLKRAAAILRHDCDRREVALRRFSDEYSATVILGRTPLQSAIREASA